MYAKARSRIKSFLLHQQIGTQAASLRRLDQKISVHIDHNIQTNCIIIITYKKKERTKLTVSLGSEETEFNWRRLLSRSSPSPLAMPIRSKGPDKERGIKNGEYKPSFQSVLRYLAK